MAKLVILRGEARHAEVELTEETLRLGRGVQNQIVLDDPGKGVSRAHAEIRFEGGRYTLTDLESQNGIWVSGTRVSSVVLDSGVVASVGPFRLMVEAPSPAAGTHDTEPIALGPLPERITGPAVPDAPGGATARSASQPGGPRPPRARLWYAQPRVWLIAGAAVLLIALLGFGTYTSMRKNEPAFDLARARVMVEGGECQQALVQHIEPALNANPGDREALELRSRCATPPVPSPPEVPSHQPPPVTPELDAIESLIAGNSCPEALDRINAVLAADPGNERARELAARATACTAPAPPQAKPRARAEALAVSEPPSQGGLDPLPQELQIDYLKRKQAMRKRYDDAVSSLASREYQRAAREFADIAQQVPGGYLELAQRRAEASDGVKAEATKAVEAAQEAERAGDFVAAAAAYRRAHALDAGVQLEEHLQRIEAQKIQRGRKRCEEGRLAFSYGNNVAAAAAFQDVLMLLPPSDTCSATARDRLKQLGK